jgi:hypothetical protein
MSMKLIKFNLARGNIILLRYLVDYNGKNLFEVVGENRDFYLLSLPRKEFAPTQSADVHLPLLIKSRDENLHNVDLDQITYLRQPRLTEEWVKIIARGVCRLVCEQCICG